MTRRLVAVLVVLLTAATAHAEVVKVTVDRRVAVADGQSFGTVGQYEKLVGTIEFALNPDDPQNAAIVDLGFAPRAADFKVHFTADLIVLRPVDPARGNGVMLFEVANRGNLGLLTRFNSATASSDPEAAAHFGNGFLMREGYTLVWIGWQFDTPNGIRIEAPPARGFSQAIGVRVMVDAAAPDAALGDARFYLPVNPDDAASTLTVRDRIWDAPTPIARSQWRFVHGPDGPPRIALTGGFQPGRWYEVTYIAGGARVVGVGMAAIRDAASAFRYRIDLPVRGTSAYAIGFSQDGRFLRQFLHEGFNLDERRRKVFDAVWIHIAGAARGTFNDRFGTPNSLAIFTPTKFPFATETQTFDGETGSLLSTYRPAERPRLFFSNTSVEYWGGGRAAALTHVTVDGRQDLKLSDDVRMYYLAGTQHGEAAFPPPRTRGQQFENPVPQREVMRALLRGLHAWVSAGTAPPASRYPTLAQRTLTPQAGVRFPAIPGVGNPRLITGPGIWNDGHSQPLPFLVPQVDADGNDLGGIRVPDVSVPLATTTGWNFRTTALGNARTEVYNNLGSYIPLARTRAERTAARDPRPSIEERYKDKDEYLQRIRIAAAALIKEGYLLDEDFDHVLARANAHWDYATRAR